LAPAQRILLVLQRLNAQAGNSAAGRLLSDYRALLALYAQAANGGGPAASARAIKAAQQRTTASARALHVPLCAPVPVSPS
jgi:hypothetical protein